MLAPGSLLVLLLQVVDRIPLPAPEPRRRGRPPRYADRLFLTRWRSWSCAICIDLANGWATFPRPKNQKPRKCHLWPETIAGLQEWLAIRPEPKSAEDAKLVYITKSGLPWHKGTFSNPLSHEMKLLLDGYTCTSVGMIIRAI